MKCRYWSGVCEIGAHVPDECDGCSHGWLPSWTPSERAGLSDMGIMHKCFKSLGQDYLALIVRGVIRAYVRASCAVKEKQNAR